MKPDINLSCALMQELGFEIHEAESRPEVFGCWFIRASAQGKMFQVFWDGREEELKIQEPKHPPKHFHFDQWRDLWIAGKKYKHKPDELRDGLQSVLAAHYH